MEKINGRPKNIVAQSFTYFYLDKGNKASGQIGGKNVKSCRTSDIEYCLHHKILGRWRAVEKRHSLGPLGNKGLILA